MKLMRVGTPGAEKPAMLATDGTIRDLSAFVRDIDGESIGPQGLSRLGEIDPQSLPTLGANLRIGPCVARPLNFVCIGLNYEDHAREANLPIPKEPIIFLKSLSAYSGPNDDVQIPRGSVKTDWEVELGIIIGTRAADIPESDALAHVAGYCVINDVSEREFQSERGGTWDKGKGCDTFGPTGPWLVTQDEIADPQQLRLWLDVDGKRMQDGNTRTMVFSVRQLVSYVSQFITLYPGDIIATGTPPGVGLGMKPSPVFLVPGQVMTLGIEGLGSQTQRLIQSANR
jgi:2-keto-4-pentenoate hydratase/2-oxohepta-3-ene-1,7-dioic acid hydratase in catechol pathway